MPKDSRTHRLLDNSLQATITPQSISPTPSLPLSLSLSLLNPSVSSPVCLLLKSPSLYPLLIVTLPASEPGSTAIWGDLMWLVVGYSVPCFLARGTSLHLLKLGWSRKMGFVFMVIFGTVFSRNTKKSSTTLLGYKTNIFGMLKH